MESPLFHFLVLTSTSHHLRSSSIASRLVSSPMRLFPVCPPPVQSASSVAETSIAPLGLDVVAPVAWRGLAHDDVARLCEADLIPVLSRIPVFFLEAFDAGGKTLVEVAN